jgi:alkaline phosphatase
MYLNNAIGEVISREHTIIGWTTHGHNGIDVPIWSYGPNRPIGFFDNTDMAKIVAENFGFDLDKVDEKLFVTVTDEFNPVKWNVDTSDPDNPVLELKGDDGWAYLPIGTDLMTYDDEDYELEGIVVQPGNGHIYIPEQVVDILD